MKTTSSDVEFAVGKVFHCSMSSWLTQRKASDGYLPATLDALKVDENVLSSLAEPTALVSLLSVLTLGCSIYC